MFYLFILHLFIILSVNEYQCYIRRVLVEQLGHDMNNIYVIQLAILFFNQSNVMKIYLIIDL